MRECVYVCVCVSVGVCESVCVSVGVCECGCQRQGPHREMNIHCRDLTLFEKPTAYRYL